MCALREIQSRRYGVGRVCERCGEQSHNSDEKRALKPVGCTEERGIISWDPRGSKLTRERERARKIMYKSEDALRAFA